MEEMIIQFITTYGWKLALIACSGIVVLGILKFFKIFDKIEKSKRKHIYGSISSAISIISSGIYLTIVGGFTWAGFGVIAGAIYAINQALYATYENSGLRNLVKKIGKLFIRFIAKDEIESAKADIIDDLAEKENKEVEKV